MSSLPHLLITAGPTHEPIDAVRYIANRSSGVLGILLADAAAARGWSVTLLLGPTHRLPTDSHVRVLRFRTTADLQGLLERELPACTVLVMAAAVADYRPKIGGGGGEGKLRRGEAPLTLELEPTPDLLAACAKQRRPGQILIGFALEPGDRLLESARAKLVRKDVDGIVANPLETMDSDTVGAVLLWRGEVEQSTPGYPGKVGKGVFAGWLLERIEERLRALRASGGA